MLEGRGLRALKVAVVVMGVLIVIAVVGLVAGVVFKLRARPATRAAVPVAAAVPTEGGAALTVLDEPAGTRVAAVVAGGAAAGAEPAGGRAGPRGAARSRERHRDSRGCRWPAERDPYFGGLRRGRGWHTKPPWPRSRSSRGPGHRPLTAVTGVRIPYGTPGSHVMSWRHVGATIAPLDATSSGRPCSAASPKIKVRRSLRADRGCAPPTPFRTKSFCFFFFRKRRPFLAFRDHGQPSM